MKYRKLITKVVLMAWIICCMLLRSSSAKLEPISESSALMRYSITACILGVAQEFNHQDVITVSLTTKSYNNYTNSIVVMDHLLLQALYKETLWTILVKKSNKAEQKSAFFKKSDTYIIQIRDNDEFYSILTSLMHKSSWNPHARFILITTTLFPNQKAVVAKIFKQLWSEMILNAIILLPQRDNSTILDIFSWFPFRNGNCGDSFDEAYIINTCRMGGFQNNNLLFPEKIPKNLNKCPVNVRVVIWPPYIIPTHNLLITTNSTDIKLTKGIEVMLMNTVAEGANFSVNYSSSDISQDWGNIYRNGTKNGMMESVASGETNIGLGAIASLRTRHLYFDTSISYIRDSVTWCVPHAMPIPRWKCLVNIFHPYTWITIFLVYISITLSVWGLSNQETQESTSYLTSLSCFQNMLSMLLGMTVKTLPRLTKLRLLIMLWVVVCLHLNAAFTSSLIRELTEPSYEQQIESEDELVRKGYELGLVSPTNRFFKVKETSGVFLTNVRWITCSDVIACLDRTAYDRNFVVGVPRLFLQYISKRYVTNKGKQLITWMKEDFVSYPIEMIMTKGFPFLRRINQLIYRIKEAGLIKKWQYDFLEKNDNKTDPIEISDRDDIILTVQHLEGSFILLVIGLMVAAIAFVCEIIVSKPKVIILQKKLSQ